MNTVLNVPNSFGSISTLVELLRYQATQHPNKNLYSFLANGETVSGSLTYSELDKRAMMIGANLQQFSSPGDRVLLMFAPGLNYISAFMGCLYAGLVAVPSYPVSSRRRDGNKLERLVEDCEPTVILLNRQQSTLFEEDGALFKDAQILSIDDLKTDLTWKQTPVNSQTLGFLQYTSGSTGTPKGVMVSHGNLMSNIELIAMKGNLQFGETGVSWLPPYHDMGLIGGLLAPMYVGIHAYLMEPVAFLQKPFRWLKAISDFKASGSVAPNFAYQLCVDRVTDEQLATLDLQHFKFALSGAEPVRQSTMKAFNDRFAEVGFKSNGLFPAYGMAETTLLITGAQAGSAYQTITADKNALFNNELKESEEGKCFVSCGSVDEKHNIAIVDPQSHKLLEDFSIGEIWVNGPSIAQGYWRKNELTKQIFSAQIIGQEGKANWLRTGDLGFIKNNNIYITGRIKDLIVIRGRNLYPQDIENAVSELDSQLSNDGCAAFSIEGDNEETLVIVQELTRQGLRSADTESLARVIRHEVMSRFSVSVADVVFIKPMTLPRTSSGKIQHSATSQAYQSNTLAMKANVPLIVEQVQQKNDSKPESKPKPESLRTNINQDEVSDWIKQALTIRYPSIAGNIRDDTAFVDLGIDSVAAIELTSELSIHLGYEISATDLWDYPTISELSHYGASLSSEVKNQQNEKKSNGSVKPEMKNNESLSNDIAVIGMACRSPGGEGQSDIESVHTLWQQLNNGQDLVGALPKTRYADMGLDEDADFPEGGYLQSIDQFDPAFFDLSPKDAACLDPQQRILLQTSIRLLEDSYLTLTDLKESKTGIFIGSSTDDYAQLSLNSVNFEDSPGYVGLGTARSVMVGRLAYFLSTQGPALQVDTACSSSAYAIHLACKSLLNGESSQAIAGGVNIIMNTDSYAALETLQAISPTGRCRTFSDDADGYIRSEACSLVMLKRVDDAIRDGDRIYGVIKASQANHDGRSNGLTAPNGKAQQRLIEELLKSANISPQDVGYVETHGTGTALGDPIEVKALDRVFASIERSLPVKLGALKSQIGHSESAAGVMALIKTMLCLQKQHIPANLYFNKPNPHINWAGLSVEPVNQSQAWPQLDDKPALAGLSSFGLSGTNVHCIVGPAPSHSSALEPSLPILKLSAKTPSALRKQVSHAYDVVQTHQEQTSFVEAFVNASHSKSNHNWRLSLNTQDQTSLLNALKTLTNLDDADFKQHSSVDSVITKKGEQKVVFLFTGQGALYESMALELYESSTLFRQHIYRCQELLKVLGQSAKIEAYTKFTLSDVLYPNDERNSSALTTPEFAQVSLFAIQTGLVELLKSYNIQASDVVGHSVGEYAAAYCAGVLSLQDGLRLLMHRGHLTQQCPEGAMLAVSLPLEEIKTELELLKQINVDVAAINSPQQCVLAGTIEEVDQLKIHLKNKGVSAQILSTTHAFHSSLMQGMIDEFQKIAFDVNYKAPLINWHSTVLARKIEADEIDANYWCEHVIKPVKFSQTITELQNITNVNSSSFDQIDCIELGPQPILSALLKQSKRPDSSVKPIFSALPMLKKPTNGRYSDIRCLSNVISTMFQKGVCIEWPRQIPSDIVAGTEGGYVFNEKRYWLTPKSPTQNSILSTLDTSSLKELESVLMSEDNDLSDQQKALIPDLLPSLIKALNNPATKPDVDSENNVDSNLSYQLEWVEKTLNKLESNSNLDILLHGLNSNQYIKNAFGYCLQLPLEIELSPDKAQTLLGLDQLLDDHNQDNSSSRIVLDLASFVDFSSDANIEADTQQSRQLLMLVQCVMKHLESRKGYELVVVLPNFIDEKNQRLGHLFAPIWGAIKSIIHEQIGFSKVIANSIVDESDAKQLCNIIGSDGTDVEYLVRDNKVYCPTLKSVKQEHVTKKSSASAYLITGGCGALGLALCAHLVEQGANTIVLVSRRPLSDLPSKTTSLITQWQKKGCSILVESVDVSQQLSVQALFERLPNILGLDASLQGIYHLAGSAADSELFTQTNVEQWESIWQPKILGAWWLHKYSQALEPKEFVLFSSIASLLGYVGQAAYSSANFYLDWLAQYRQQLGLSGTAINWGPWQGDGMAGSALVNKAMAQVGVNGLEASSALNAMSSNLDSRQLAVMNIDWSCISQQFNSRVVNGILSTLKDTSQNQVGSEQTLKDRVANASEKERYSLLLDWLTQRLANILDASPSDLDVQSPLISLGMDSIRSLDIKHDIHKETGVDVPVTLFLNNISLQDLTDFLAEQLNDNQNSLSNGLSLDNHIVAEPKGSPLSSAQQRLWLVDQWQQQKGLYNIHSTIRVEGVFDDERFTQAMQEVVNRHESLRTTFSSDSENPDGPLQRIKTNIDVPMSHYYWSTADDNQASLESFARTQAHQTFDLSAGPLINIAVVHIDAKPVTYVCLTLHHIIADAWSMDVLIRDFSLAYLTQKALAPLPIEYRHYSAWQHQYLEQRMSGLESYWLPQLSNAVTTEFPSDLPRPERQDLSGRCLRFSVTEVQTKRLKELAEQQGVTLFVLLLSSFFVLLSKLTKKQDLLIGTDTANRDQTATTDLIGFFVNVLALRTDLSGNPTFNQIVAQVNTVVQDSITNQDMPFHHLVDKLKVSRQNDRNPLVQILFVLQNAQSADLKIDGLDIQPVDIDEQVCRFDQSLFIKEKNGQLEGYWHYATALFTSALIKDQSTQFCDLLSLIIDNPTHPLERLIMNPSTDSSSTNAKARKARKRSSFGKFKNASPTTVAPKALVEKQPYQEGVLMPLMVSATNQDIDAAGWANAEREGIIKDLKKHGAILFRNFPLNNAADFELFASKICPTLFGDYGDLPKEKGGKKIYHSTPYPKDKRILFHNESSHMHQWPTRQLFFCVKAAEKGGATPIVDCREVYRQLDPSIRDEFENKHLRYTRNFSRNLDVSWQKFFKTEDRQMVEQICQRNGVEYQWQGADGLRTHELRRAVTHHEGSGLKSFFNQIQLHHSAFLPKEVRESLMAITGLEGLPRHLSFGDGSPISDEVAIYTYDLYEKLAVRFDWQPGDVVLLDNMAVAHARDSFEGERKINVAMGEMESQKGTIILPDNPSNESSTIPNSLIVPTSDADSIHSE